MGGGGGDDYSAKAAEAEAKKQKARDALNLQFGVAPTGTAPDRASFTKQVPYITSPTDDNGSGGQGIGYTTEADDAGYQKALADFNTQGGEAAKNKTARDLLYGTVRTNAFDAGKRRFDEQKTTAARDLKFALAAQGLLGGSEQVNQGALLGRTYDQGLLDLGAKADSARADLQASDETTRLGLLQSIDAGMDQGSALSSALNQLKNNNDSAAAAATGTNLGDLFGGAGLLYSKSNKARGNQAGTAYWNNMYGTGAQNPAAAGIVTKTP